MYGLPIATTGFQPARYQPSQIRPPQRFLAYGPPTSEGNASMGSPASMDASDWLMLGGGAIVAGVGVNGMIGQFSGNRFSAVGFLLDVVLLGLGGTIFLQKLGKMTA